MTRASSAPRKEVGLWSSANYTLPRFAARGLLSYTDTRNTRLEKILFRRRRMFTNAVSAKKRDRKSRLGAEGYERLRTSQVPMECKVVLVGDSKCGKSALLHRFVNDNFLRVYTPTDFERCSVDHTVGDVRVEFTLWDTSGAYAYDTVRPLSYKDARAFLLCFDIATPPTLDTALKKWYPEIRRHSSAPIVLCGCRSDLRGEVRHFVTPEQAILACRQMEAAGYVETSAKEEVGVVDAFELCGLAATGSKPRFASLVRRHAPHLKQHIHSNPHRSCTVM